MQFLNRTEEIARINLARSKSERVLVILYGRRRLGKTRLLQQILDEEDILFAADLSETTLQIGTFAKLVGEKYPGFDAVIYPDWESFFISLNNRAEKRFTLVIDEFPYLVKNAPEFPSVLQKIIDQHSPLAFDLILCGSSQQLMQNIVIDGSAPLFGRASEIIKLSPMNVYWLKQALNCTFPEAVEEYCIWGGVPRYWELRKTESSMKQAVVRHILDRNGVLHEEPVRLFLDDTRDTVQMSTLITLIASGANRLSVIAARIGKPATHLSRPLQRLIDLGYIKREIPFSVSPLKSKRTLYKLADPFINFYYRFVVPDRTYLELGMARQIYDESVRPDFPEYCSGFWEDICRSSIPFLIKDKLFEPGSRWWSGSKPDHQKEIDIVSASKDGSELFIAEVKWAASVNVVSVCNDLDRKISLIPGSTNKIIRKALFLKNIPDFVPEGFLAFTPEQVIQAYEPDAEPSMDPENS